MPVLVLIALLSFGGLAWAQQPVITGDPFQCFQMSGAPASSLRNYGPNVPFDGLGLTEWPYEGRQPEAAWRRAAADRIEKIRQADIAVVVRDDSGNPVPNAPVRVKMKRHAFPFGSAVDAGTLQRNSTYADTFKRLFNAAVTENDLKWPVWESNRNPASYSLNWLAQNGVAARGHNLIWPGRSNLPADVVMMIDRGDREALRNRIYSHIAEIMAWTKGQVVEWDVLNEPLTNRDVQALLGDQEMAAWFQKARPADPAVKLYVNEVGITENGGYDLNRQNAYYQVAKGILDAGAPLDGLGLQSHFSNILTAPARVLEVFDRFAQLGKDLEITEFDVNIADEQLQADYFRDYLIASFSHPAVKGFFMWGFWEGRHWRPQAAMIRQDWSVKPAYNVWQQLVFRDWWTDVQGSTGQDGVFRTRGFLGYYDVEVTLGGQTRTMPLAVAGGRPNYLLMGKQTPGSIAAEGVVNAASFARGPVAPGEIVEIWGTGYGSTAPVVGAYDGSQLRTYGGDTRVFFDGLEAPLVHTMRWDSDPKVGRVAAVAPYSVSGQTRIEIEYLGTKTAAVTVPVASAAPGLFCYSAGTGQAVAMNHHADGTISLNRDRPLSRGEYLEFYLTGEGQTNPPGADGKRTPYPDNPVPAQEVVVRIGGVESRKSDCPYNWIGQVWAGVTQINACVPRDAPRGAAVPLSVSIGGVLSQSGVTVAVQ